MYLNILLTIILSLTHIAITFSQTSFPFVHQTENHSSYHGLIASVSIHTSIQNAASALRFEDSYTQSISTTSDISGQVITTSIIKDNNGNPIADVETTAQYIESNTQTEKANVHISFNNAGFVCNNELELTLGFETYTMNNPEMDLQLPEGRYYYRIKGDLSCTSTDGCQIDNTGIIDISGNTNLVLTWQVTEYQSCWMTIRKESYYTSVID